MSDKPVSDLSFEEAMAELENLVSRLEGSQVALEDSIRLYERGEALKKHCEAKLKAAEEKVEQIMLGENQQPTGSKPVEGL
ncbi:MAG: exodeoxyribonuclease VII small subunit [Rhodobacteraceae bacterium]|nr:exodeoxyribonuclease VII small subunit [Paracoccaceae bacterium]